jgi:ankyrin repeat protein
MGASHRLVVSGQVEEVVTFFKKHPERIEERDQDADGSTPLLTALQARRIDIAEALLKLGASPSKADRHGMTPLMKCGQLELVHFTKIVLTHDIDVNAQDSVDGLTALDWALLNRNNDLIKILRNHGGRAKVAIDDAV